MDKKKKRYAPRERELVLLLNIEQSMTELKKSHGRPTQRYDFLTDPLAQVKSERVVLERALAGDSEAVQLRRAKRDAANGMGQR